MQDSDKLCIFASSLIPTGLQPSFASRFLSPKRFYFCNLINPQPSSVSGRWRLNKSAPTQAVLQRIRMPQNKGNNGAINCCLPVSSTQSGEKYPLHKTRKPLRPRSSPLGALIRIFGLKAPSVLKKSTPFRPNTKPAPTPSGRPELVYLGLVFPTLREAPRTPQIPSFRGL